MIGNTIEFLSFEDGKSEILTGLVVDAYTKISGHIKGETDVFLGFGGGKTSGSTKSNRIYKVEHYNSWDTSKMLLKYSDISASQLKRIIKFHPQNKQENLEEKFHNGGEKKC